MLSKTEMRQWARSRRIEMSEDDRKQESALICDRLWILLERTPILQSDIPIAIYLANALEVNIDAVARRLLEGRRAVVAPILTQSGDNVDDALPFYTLEAELHNLHCAWRGLREPMPYLGGRAYSAKEVRLFMVPGLAFDASGQRLGQGGGWYDRVLQDAPNAITIGVCFDRQIASEVPVEPHDRRMNYVVTEARILNGEELPSLT